MDIAEDVKAVPADFDAWLNEREGFGIRAERLTGPKDELMAAFEAGVEAERGRERTEAMPSRTFAVDDRVKLSEAAAQRYPALAGRRGTIVSLSRGGKYRVRFDGRQTADVWASGLLEALSPPSRNKRNGIERVAGNCDGARMSPSKSAQT
jgi:hypothetical protein